MDSIKDGPVDTREMVERMRLMQLELAQVKSRVEEKDNQIRERDNQIRERDNQLRENHNQLQNTTLEELLECCHDIYNTFRVQNIVAWTTKGTMTKPEKKPCPERLIPWEEFIVERHEAFDSLCGLLRLKDSHGARLFMSKAELRGAGILVPGKSIGSEGNLREFRQMAVENLLIHLTTCLAKEDGYQDKLHLRRAIYFDDHSNTLNDAAVDVQAIRDPQNLRTKPIMADRMCCSIGDNNLRDLIFLIEQKAPHKLTQRMFEIGLREMNIPQEIVNDFELPTEEMAKLRHNAEKLVAAALSQAYGYMIQGGVKYGCVETGEATVFLKVERLEPNNLYYHLAIPKRDVTAMHVDGQPFPHELTALGQLLSFFLMSLKAPREDANWRANALKGAHQWLLDEEAFLKNIPNEEYQPGTPSSMYEPSPIASRNRNVTPLPSRQLRPRRNRCQEGQDEEVNNSDDSTQSRFEDQNDTPTKVPEQLQGRGARGKGKENQRTSAPSYNNKQTPYCTHACLLGLVNGSRLDDSCPNITFHRRNANQTKHLLSRTNLCRRIRWQLKKDLVGGFTDLQLQGARSNVFKITLLTHGYTLIAKGTIDIFIPDLKHEAEVYQRLRPLQGLVIPVCIGNVDLHTPYWDVGVCIIHLLLMSWAGNRIATLGQREGLDNIEAQMKKLGVEHADLDRQNLMWNEETETETGRLMVIDFERSIIKPLGKQKLQLAREKLMLEKQVLGHSTGNSKRRDCKARKIASSKSESPMKTSATDGPLTLESFTAASDPVQEELLPWNLMPISEESENLVGIEM